MRRRPLARAFAATGGLVIWAVQFTAVYGFTALACARGYARAAFLGIGVVPLVVTVLTLAALVPTGLLLMRSHRRDRRLALANGHATDRFLDRSAVLVSGLSLVAIVWTGLPAVVLPACP